MPAPNGGTVTLTDKQIAFCEAYLQHFNATRAAKEAGYSERTAYSIGGENLKKPELALYIRERLNEAAMGADEVLFHLAQIARGDITEVMNEGGEVSITAARVAGKSNLIKRVRSRTITTDNSDIHETEAEGYDRLKALELLGRAHGLFIDRVQHDWKPAAVELIRAGEINYDVMVRDFGMSLADELFRLAGVPSR